MAKRFKIATHHVHIEDDVEHLVAELTTHIRAAANARRQQQRHYYLSLAGGTTPKRLYTSLAADPHFDVELWRCFEIYFGDERYVPHSSTDSNYHMAKLAWLDLVSIPPQQIHPVPTHCVNIEKCVEEYNSQLNSMPKQNGIPCFDLVLLGMGDDGHTASLFPGTPVLEETRKWLASVNVTKLDSRRVTFTYPLINNAQEIIVLVTGANKAGMLKRVLHEPAANLPIQNIRNRAGVHWYVDAAAAAELT